MRGAGQDAIPGARAFAIIFTTVLINMIGFGIIIPVMPQLIMEVTGQDLAHAAKWGGVLSLVYAFMQFFMMPVMGALSDRYGRRPIILGSLAAFSIDFLLMAVAPTLAFLLAARVIAGAFAATFSTANAYIADITPADKRAARFGVMGAAFGLGFIIGPGVGGLLGDAFGPRAPFYAVASLGLINFALGWFLLPETLDAAHRRAFDWRRANALGNAAQLAKYPALVPIAVAVFFAQLGHWTFPSVWSYFAQARFDWGPREIGYSLMAVGFSAALVQGGLTKHAVAALGERRAALTGFAIGAVAYLGYGFADQGWMIYLLIAFGALGGFAQPALQAIMSRAMPANAQGELQGMVGALQGLSMIIGPYVMTQVFAAFIAPGEPLTLAGVTLLPDGAPFRFPGASFVLASCLTAISLVILVFAFQKMERAAPAAQSSAAE